MTAHAFPTQADIAAALDVLRLAGYSIKPPQGADPCDSKAISAPIMGALPRRKTYKGWGSAYILLSFADGEVVGAYATREPGKGWYLGSAVRVASDKYRERRTPHMSDIDKEMHYARKIPVPDVTEITCDDETIECDLDALNAATSPYRSGLLAYGVRGY